MYQFILFLDTYTSGLPDIPIFLGVDILPAGIEDIRDKIHNKPERVFAVKDGSEVYYVGLNSVR